MMLYLLRHGEAEPHAPNDAARRLTAHGRQEVDSVARQFLVNKLPLQLCIASPYVRAVQTAELFLDQVAPALALSQDPLLTPEVRAGDVMRLLETLQAEQVLLVSHNPLLSELNALLIDGDISHMHILATSELVAINIDVIGLGMGRTVLRLAPGTTPALD
jgi:phosphohistidine phosphatase